MIFDDLVYSGKTLDALKNTLEKRGAKSIRKYALIDARKNNQVEIDDACIKGDYYTAYFGVGMDVLGVGGIKDGKYKQDIWDAGKRKPKKRHGDVLPKPKEEIENAGEEPEENNADIER